MSLHINEKAPDFTQQSTLGEINLYDYLGNSWGESYFLILKISHLFAPQS